MRPIIARRPVAASSRIPPFLLLAALLILLPSSLTASIAVDSQRLFREQPAAGKILVASESIRDPRFRESVILLLNHDENGSLGLIINRPTRVPLSELFDDAPPGVLHFGGPVQTSVLSLLAEGALPADEPEGGRSPIFDSVWFVFGADAVVEQLSAHDSTDAVRVYSGYAGWSAGQLEAEIRSGGWLLTMANPEMIFAADPATVWEDLLRQLRGRWI